MQNEHIVFSNDKFSIHVSGTLLPGHAEDQTDKVVDQHFHEEYEFLYCQRDNLDFVIENVNYRLCPGDVMFVNSLVPHKTISYKDTAYLLVQFKSPFEVGGALKHLGRLNGAADNLCYVFKSGMPQTEEISDLIIKMIEEDNQKRAAFEYFMSANMHMIMAVLYRNGIVSEDVKLACFRNIEKVMPVIEFIEKNFDKQISLSDAAAVLNIDKAYFCRLFKKICNCTFTEYLNFVRICKAESMLKNGESVSGTAYSVGFSSQSYFNKIFKKYKLCSPAEYKNICKRRGK